MHVELGKELGSGMFGSVYEAIDELGRRVAVKFIRASGELVSSALDHARALARAAHPNVIVVYSIERLIDPTTGVEAPGVVMERIDGGTLRDRLRGEPLLRAEAHTIITGLLDGLGHIHAQGLAHGDLHEENVLVAGPVTKIIDIMYTTSLGAMYTTSREVRIRRDILKARTLVTDILASSELPAGDAEEFNASLPRDPSMEDIRRAALSILNPERRTDVAVLLAQAMTYVRDDAFVEGMDYARALSAETAEVVILPLLKALLSERIMSKKHRQYVRELWNRLGATQRAELARELAVAIDREVPNGHWNPPINMLHALGGDGWRGLPERTRLRLEVALVNSINAGRVDVWEKRLVRNQGVLGTHARRLWQYFGDRDRLVNALSERLGSDWYGQNYVAQYFMSALPLIADTPSRRAQMLEALKAAYANDAKLIVSGIDQLPPDWQDAIREP